MYVKSGHKNKVHEVRKDTPKPHYFPQNNLPLSNIYLLALPLTKRLLSYTKLLPFFVMSDKGCITERPSSHHHWKSQTRQHHHHLLHQKRNPQQTRVMVKVQNH